MKLIVESAPEIQYLTEEKDGKKHLFIEGIFLQSEIKNGNGRVYPRAILEREVARYVKENVERNTAYGELNHPNCNSAQVNLDRVALMVKTLRQEGNDFIGKAKILSTPMGNIARSLIEDGANLGVSSRGLGTLKRNKAGHQEVCEDFRLMVCSDIVANPSAPNAFVNGIMEGVEFRWDEEHGWVQGLVEETRREWVKVSSKKINESQEQILEKFLIDLVQHKHRYT